MKIKKLYAENIYSFKKLEVDFLSFAGVISIILGKNLDQKTANGAGKTSILKALYWSLWNKELNGATIEEMVNRVYPESGMLAILEFEDRGYEYKITRYKSYKPNASSPKLHNGNVVSGSGVEFLVNGQPFMGESHTKTQSIIEQKIKMTPRLFLSCVLMAQNTKSTFLTANDSEKKELLSELLDLQAYEKAFKNVKEAIKEVEEKITINENKIEVLNEQIDSFKNQISQLEIQEKDYEESSKIKKNEVSNQIKVLEEQMEGLKKIAHQSVKSEALKKKLLEEESKIKQIKKELDTEHPINQALFGLETQFQNDDVLLKNLENSIKEKKLKIEDLSTSFLNTEIKDFQKEKQDISGKINSLKDEIKFLEARKQETQLQINNRDNILKILNSLILESEANIHQIEDLKNNSLCTACQRIFKEGENSSLDNLLDKLIKKSKEISAEIAKNNEIIFSIDKAEEKLTQENQVIAFKNKELEDYLIELDKLIVADTEQRIFQQKRELLLNQKNEIEKECLDMENKINSLSKQIKVNNKKISDIIKLKEKFEPLKKELSDLEIKINELLENIKIEEEKEVEIRIAKASFKEKFDAVNSLQKELNELETKVNPYLGMKNNLLKQKETFISKLNAMKSTVADNQEELKYLNFWKIGFAPIGIRSFITDDVIELLNRKTQENLNDLFDGAISVMFDPESKNNKGLVSNKISTVFLQNGKETSFNLLSGGEQQRAILATELALTEVAEARAGTKLNIRFLDEPFNGMDNNGQVKSLSLFARIAREKDGFFVISHDENFQHLCQKALFVLKSKEISYIVDKENFNSTFIDKEESAEADSKKEKRKFNFDRALKKKQEIDED